MKCTGISVGNNHPRDSRTMGQFVGSEQAGTPLGKLLSALVAENVWSDRYEVYASFGKEPFLNIDNPTLFLPGYPLIIREKDGDNLSVRKVEDMVRAHIRGTMESLRPAIDILQGQSNDLYRALDQIDTHKAKAAIVAVFPEAAETIPVPSEMGDGGLYAFSAGAGTAPVFVARAIDHEFVGGVARLNLSRSDWYMMGNGGGQHERHAKFWVALARAFAARKLQIQEDDFLGNGLIRTQWEDRPQQADPHVVEKVVLRLPDSTDVIVRFGSDNLPAKMHFAPNASLVDKHMMP